MIMVTRQLASWLERAPDYGKRRQVCVAPTPASMSAKISTFAIGVRITETSHIKGTQQGVRSVCLRTRVDRRL